MILLGTQPVSKNSRLTGFAEISSLDEGYCSINKKESQQFFAVPEVICETSLFVV
jgi:hypothetical protein